MAKKREKLLSPDWYLKLEANYLQALEDKQDAEQRIEKCKAAMLAMMECDGLSCIITNLTKATYIEASTCRKFNSTDFKKNHPALYEQYAAKYQKDAYVQIKMMNQIE